jgi:hypothetical protein
MSNNEDTQASSAPGPSPASWKKNTTKADDPPNAWKGIKSPGAEKKITKDAPAKISKGNEKPAAKRHLTRNSCKDLKNEEDETLAWCPPGGADEEEFL